MQILIKYQLQLFHVIKSLRQERRLSLEDEGKVQLLVSRKDVLQNYLREHLNPWRSHKATAYNIAYSMKLL